MLKLILIFILVTLNPVFANSYYQWKDKNGGIHFTDNPLEIEDPNHPDNPDNSHISVIELNLKFKASLPKIICDLIHKNRTQLFEQKFKTSEVCETYTSSLYSSCFNR